MHGGSFRHRRTRPRSALSAAGWGRAISPSDVHLASRQTARDQVIAREIRDELARVLRVDHEDHVFPDGLRMFQREAPGDDGTLPQPDPDAMAELLEERFLLVPVPEL